MKSPLRIKKISQRLVTHSGLALVGHLISRSGFDSKLNSFPHAKKSNISHADIIKSLAGVISVGKPSFEAIEEFRRDDFFAECMEINHVPSPETLRQRTEQFGSEMKQLLIDHSLELIKSNDTQISCCFGNYVPLDLDVSPFDNSGTKKEKVSYTYKGHDGFAPIFAYLGQHEGYLINHELREGSQHCQKGTPSFLKASIRSAKKLTSKPILVRLDGGNDSRENIDICSENNVEWVVKRNPRKEKDSWVELALEAGTVTEPREGKKIYRGFAEESHDGKRYVTAYEVTERTVRADGQHLLFPDYSVDLYLTSLEHLSVENIVGIYHQHGTSEQFHSELKTDLDLERLPSGKFHANEIFLAVGALVYNVLRLIGQQSLNLNDDLPTESKAPMKKRVRRRRIRSVMQDIVYFAGSFSKRSRQFTISIWNKNPWGSLLERLALHFGILRL